MRLCLSTETFRVCNSMLEREFILVRRNFIRRDIRSLLATVLVASITPFAEHHHFVGDDFHTSVLDAFLVIPAPGLQTSFNVHLLAFVEILFADLCQVAPGNNVEPFCFVVTFAIHGVPRTADRYREGCDGPPRGGVAHFGVTSQMTNDLYFVKASAHV